MHFKINITIGIKILHFLTLVHLDILLVMSDLNGLDQGQHRDHGVMLSKSKMVREQI